MPEMKTPTATKPITTRTIGHYLDTLGSSDATPGGGSASGIIGALGASLGLMVVSLTSTEEPEATTSLDDARECLAALQKRFTRLAEEDEAVYRAYRDAVGMPRTTAEDKTARREAIQSALKSAASVPVAACEASVELGNTLVPVRQYGNPYLLSDTQIAMLCAETCFEASRINVDVNLAMIKDDAWTADISNTVETLGERLRQYLHGE